MGELVPVILGVVLGALVWIPTTGCVRFAPRIVALSASAVLASGLAATALSGEYQQTWLFLSLDLGEAAIGLAVGMLVARLVGGMVGSLAPSDRVAARVRLPAEHGRDVEASERLPTQTG